MLLRRGVSNAALPPFHMTLNGDDFDHVSALQSLSIEAFEERNTRWRGIAGGNDRLPKALAAKLGHRVQYGAAMTKVEQTGRKCRTAFQQARRTTSDRVRSCDSHDSFFSSPKGGDGWLEARRARSRP
jgi:monoamine oxidase